MDRRKFLRYSTAASVLVASRGLAESRPCPPELSGAASSGSATCPSNAEADWLARSTEPGVQWAHDFRTDDEVTFWIWVNGIGDDPRRQSAGGKQVTRDTTDGITGGGCLKISRSGNREPGHWWRPMSPMSESGRGQPDNGWLPGMPTIDPPKDGWATRISSWDHGNYGPNSTGSWEGGEFYLQVRMKLDRRRRDAGVNGGKIIYLTRTERSLTSQELVTYYKGSTRFSIYRAGSPEVPSHIPNVEHVWDEWVTYLYHVSPGDNGARNTTIEVWRALAGETSYTKVFETFDEPVSYDQAYSKAWNAVLVSAYHNGIEMPDFWQKYDQIILSREPISCPRV